MKQDTIGMNGNILEENFNENILNYDFFVDELFGKNTNKPLFIVAAGPSLDKNVGELAKVSKGGTILAVGRAVRTLLKHNIYPDYIIITDPSEKLYSMQLEGLDIDVPIIVLSTCDKNVMNKYKGRKYIALQRGFDKAEKYAKDKKVNLVETGGSVATTALDIAIKMKSNPIVFVGQDLAYTENKTHSKETFSKNTVDSNSLREVQDINGNIVKTSKNLYIYLRWIQNRIEKEENIDFIDATEGGARIKGTKVMKLSQIIEKIIKSQYLG